jgi:signal transduction histidine kinase
VLTVEGAFMPLRAIIFLIAVLSAFAPPATAVELGTKEEAVAMVKRIQEKFKKDGAEQTIKAVSTTEFQVNSLDPFISDLNGLLVAGAQRPLIGKTIIDIKDPDGKYPIRMMIDIAKDPGNGWLNYKWLNPRTAKIQEKMTYIEKMGDYFVGSGIYLK